MPNLRSLVIKAPCEITKGKAKNLMLSRLETLKILSPGVRFGKSWDKSMIATCFLFNFYFSHIIVPITSLRHLTLDQKQMNLKKSLSPKFFTQLPSLVKLKVDFCLNKLLFESLLCLTSVEKLVICPNMIDQIDFERLFGIQLQVFENFLRLADVKLPKLNFFNCHEIQKRFPSIKFRWTLSRRLDKLNQGDSNRSHICTYQGQFSTRNLFEGGAIVEYLNGNRFEGNFVDGLREGFGKIFF